MAARESSADARATRAPAAPAPLRPDAWLNRIIGLRAAHDDALADQELAQFERSYPDLPVPEAARRPGVKVP
jgi:hypothetical protein